jgi:hypothetical protein
VSTTPPRHVQGRPFEKTGFIQQQTDDDNGDEGSGRIPDNLPNRQNIGELDHA